MDIFGQRLGGPFLTKPKLTLFGIMSQAGTYECILGIAVGAVVGVFTTVIVSKIFSKDDLGLSNTGKEEKGYEFDDKQDYRMMLAVRNDLKMGKGKIAAQCCHAAVMAYDAVLKRRPYLLRPWMYNGTAKIAVRVESEAELLDLEKKAKALKVLTRIVRDAGHTQVAPMSRTVLALGPAPKRVLDKITGHLKLL